MYITFQLVFIFQFVLWVVLICSLVALWLLSIFLVVLGFFSMLFYFHIHDGVNVVCSHLFVFYVEHHRSLSSNV
jgi:hypothetical protein